MSAARTMGNRLISMLPERQRKLLDAHLEPVSLLKRAVLTRGNQPIDAVYFIESGLACATWSGLPERPIDILLMGRAGMVGTPLVLGVQATPFHVRMLTSGSALRIMAPDFTRLLADDRELQAYFLRFAAFQLMLLAQTATCNAVHPIRERVPFWLLRFQDQLGSPALPISHQTLGHMLGVRRASISEAITALEAKGAIQSGHARVAIISREKLINESCACYRALQRQTQAALGFSLAETE